MRAGREGVPFVRQMTRSACPTTDEGDLVLGGAARGAEAERRAHPCSGAGSTPSLDEGDRTDRAHDEEDHGHAEETALAAIREESEKTAHRHGSTSFGRFPVGLRATG